MCGGERWSKSSAVHGGVASHLASSRFIVQVPV